MAQVRTRKNKKNPHYGFLVSWEPKQAKKAHVKGETKFEVGNTPASDRHGKRADSLAQLKAETVTKKGIVRSLILISLVLVLELVIYLAWNKFMIK